MTVIGRYQFDPFLQGKCVLCYEKKYHIIDNNVKVFHGDIVRYNPETKEIINVETKNTNCICGVIRISSNVCYGFNKKKAQIKKFRPSDKKMPKFLVPIRKEYQPIDIYTVIKLNNWNDKIPIGMIERIVGNVGDYDVEHQYIKAKCIMNWRNNKNFKINDHQVDLTPNRIDLTSNFIVSIDPIGCKDIDDCLHIVQLTNNIIEIGIHIADVSSYIPCNSPLDREISKRCSSIYLVNEEINMLPDQLVYEHCSLTMGEIRRAYSVIILIDINIGEVIERKFIKSYIKNKVNLSYEEADKILYGRENSELYNTLTLLYKIGNILYTKRKRYGVLLNNDDYDIHKMVEMYMILANIEVAKYLIEKIPNVVLLRKHSGIKSERNITKRNNIPNKIIEKINIFNTSRAEYCVGFNNSEHHGLHEKYYTHFTSPIRRFADIIVHRMLYGTLNNSPIEYDYYNLFLTVSHINDTIKTYQDCERESYCLETIYKLYADNKIEFETIGYIIGIYDNKVRIYIPKINLDEDATLYSKKARHLIDSIADYDEITLFSKGNVLKLILSDIVKIRIVINIRSSTKKLLIQLINPNPIDLYN